jgi:hypothetical protein
MKTTSKIGAIAFVLWGILHVVGSSAILFALLDGPASGFAVYQYSVGEYTALSGAILGYLAFMLLCIGAAVAVIGIRFNWRNSQSGLAANTALAGLTEVGLVIFLLIPGFVGFAEASLGLALLAVGVVAGGRACQAEHLGESIDAARASVARPDSV